jgi:hypothetical protein
MNLQLMPTGQLVERYRETLLALGADRTRDVLLKRANRYEEEILRRMAW